MMLPPGPDIPTFDSIQAAREAQLTARLELIRMLPAGDELRDVLMDEIAADYEPKGPVS